MLEHKELLLPSYNAIWKITMKVKYASQTNDTERNISTRNLYDDVIKSKIR